MRAISDHYSVEEATALAIRAGVDVLLFCHEIDQAVVAFEFLCDEADRDATVRARIEESYRRVTELKRRYLTSFTGVAENEIVARLEELNHRELLSVFGTRSGGISRSSEATQPFVMPVLRHVFGRTSSSRQGPGSLTGCPLPC